MARFHYERGKFPSQAERYFDFADLDPFFCEDVIHVIYGNEWESVLIEDGQHAYLHILEPCPIADTGLYDIEPLIGYAGPLSNTIDREFLKQALQEYSSFCSERKIIAELVRFNPHLRNHVALIGVNPKLRFVENKPIAYLPVSTDDQMMLSTYSHKCRNMVRTGQSHYDIR